jgi:hypothetical protein
LVGGGDVGLDEFSERGQLAEHRSGAGAGGDGGVGHLREAEALFDLGDEALVDLPQQPGDMRGQGALGQAGLLEIAREEQVHEVGGELVYRGLRGQVGTVDMVDAAVTAVGIEEGLFDEVEVHGGANQRAVNRLGRRQASLNRDMRRSARPVTTTARSDAANVTIS